MPAKPVAERLLERLRALGLNVPEGARILKADADSGWAFSVLTADGADLRIGSPDSATTLMREDRLAAVRPSFGGLTRIVPARPEHDTADPSRFGLLLVEPQIIY